MATTPVGVPGLALEHLCRTTLGKPIPAAAFRLANGAVLYLGERLRRHTAPADDPEATLVIPAIHGHNPAEDTVVLAPIAEHPGRSVDSGAAADTRLSRMSIWQGTLVGSAQILALLPGISRSGITMVAGLLRGLSHEDAARFSFLLATPVILAAGVLKIPDLFGPLGAGIHGQVLAGSLASFVSANLAVRFLTRYFHTRTLTPFAIYCAIAGVASLAWLTLT